MFMWARTAETCSEVSYNTLLKHIDAAELGQPRRNSTSLDRRKISNSPKNLIGLHVSMHRLLLWKTFNLISAALVDSLFTFRFSFVSFYFVSQMIKSALSPTFGNLGEEWKTCRTTSCAVRQQWMWAIQNGGTSSTFDLKTVFIDKLQPK